MVYTPATTIPANGTAAAAAPGTRQAAPDYDAHSARLNEMAAANLALMTDIPVGSAGGGPMMVQVASKDASTAIKSRADYVCDGTNDEVEINAAIVKAATLAAYNASTPSGAQQSGTVQLSGGRFVIQAPIAMYTGVWLRGMGPLTELRSSGNTGTGVITLATPDTHLTHLSDFYLYGNSSSGGTCNGIHYDMTSSGNTSTYPDTNPDSYHWINDIYVDQFTTGTRVAINLIATGTANNRANILDRIQVRDSSSHGISLNGSSDSFLSNCHVGGSAGNGFNISTGNTKITNCKAFYSDGIGLYCGGGRGTLTGFESQDNATGIWFDGSPWSCAGLTVDTSSADGIVVSTSHLVIAGFSIFLRSGGRYTTQTNGLRYDASYTDLSITGQVEPGSLTTPISGTPGSRSFVRVSNGTSLISAG